MPDFLRRSISLLRVSILFSAKLFRDSSRQLILRRVMLCSNMLIKHSRHWSPHLVLAMLMRSRVTRDLLCVSPRAKAEPPSLLILFLHKSRRTRLVFSANASPSKIPSRSPRPQFSRRSSLTYLFFFRAFESCVVYSSALIWNAALLLMSMVVSEGSLSATFWINSVVDGCFETPHRRAGAVLTGPSCAGAAFSNIFMRSAKDMHNFSTTINICWPKKSANRKPSRKGRGCGAR
mmetsp:Transcript_31697/g.74708  ORF Transcript_31697/g.74708 Transcript_31697/m.74708 type:complete len:234 (+) Transcript_31697:766-1467(+)